MFPVRLKLFEPWRGLVYGLPHVATAIIGAGVASAGASIYGSSKAANTQAKAAAANNERLDRQYYQTREDLIPYRDAGQNAEGMLRHRLPELTAAITMDQNALEQTPGYQFTRTQGLKAVQNSAAARGLGASGAAQKGAADFATGLANNTYKDQFNIANINQSNAYNRLMGLVQVGQNAAAQTGTLGNQIVGQQVANTTSGANAQAAGYNALGSAVGNAANSVAAGSIYNGLYGGGSPYMYGQYSPTGGIF